MSYQSLQTKRAYVRGKYIVGIDPAKAKHQATLIDADGLRCGKSFTFKTDFQGYTETLWKKLGKVRENINPEDVIFAIERSCNLWLTVAEYLRLEGYSVVMVSPLVTRRSRPFIGNDFSRTDPKDALLIASNARQGYFSFYEKYPPQIEGMHRLSIAYDKLRKNFVQQQQRIRSLVESIFPEFFKVFNLDTRTSIYLLRRYLSPDEFLQMDVERESEQIVRLSLGHHSVASLVKLREFAKVSIGCQREGEDLSADRLLLDCWLTLLEVVRGEMKKVLDQLIRLTKSSPAFAILCELKGISSKLAALFIAETRDPRLFGHYKQLEKMAGLNIRLSQSGDGFGPRHISHMGNNRLRWVIYKMTEETAKYIPEVRIKFIKRQLKRRCYKKNLIAASPNLLKLMMALIREGRVYEYREPLVAEMRKLEIEYERIKQKAKHKRSLKAA